jgi:hypothetical protein
LQSSGRSLNDGTKRGAAPAGGFPGVTRPGWVRLLFLAVVLYALAGEIIRKEWRQPYPGLFMPGFPGTGLLRMTAQEGQTNVVRTTVHFADGSSVEVPRGDLFGNDFFPSTLPVKYFRMGREKGKDGPLPDDAKAFLAARLKQLFPGRPVTSATMEALRVAFPLDRPREQRVVGVDDAREIPLGP